LIREKQKDADATYAAMLKKDSGAICWSKSAEEIERLIRGCTPWPSAYTMLHGKTLKIWDADVLSEEADVPCGTIWRVEKDRMIVRTGKGSLGIRRVQQEGKKQMDTAAFLRGYPQKAGEHFD
jgi:methionyl-tRNA formyltransferase